MVCECEQKLIYLPALSHIWEEWEERSHSFIGVIVCGVTVAHAERLYLWTEEESGFAQSQNLPWYFLLSQCQCGAAESITSVSNTLWVWESHTHSIDFSLRESQTTWLDFSLTF